MVIDNYYLLLLPQGKESPEKSIKTKKILQRQLSEVKIQQPTTDSNLSVSMSLRNWNKQISKPQIKPKWKKKTLNKYMYYWNWNTIWTGNSICTLSIVQTYLCTFTWGRLLPVFFSSDAISKYVGFCSVFPFKLISSTTSQKNLGNSQTTTKS